MKPELVELAESIEASLAAIAEKLDIAATAEAALGELLELLQARKGIDLSPLVAAVRECAPVVTVNVPPAPQPVVQVLPAPAQGEWEITRPGSYGQADVVLARIKRIA
jgi:hypothetical protein